MILAIKSVALNRERNPANPAGRVAGLLFGDGGRVGVRKPRQLLEPRARAWVWLTTCRPNKRGRENTGRAMDWPRMKGQRHTRVNLVDPMGVANLPLGGRRGEDVAGVQEHPDRTLKCPRKSAFRAGRYRLRSDWTRATRGVACHDIFVRCPMMIRPNCTKCWRNPVSVRVETWKS